MAHKALFIEGGDSVGKNHLVRGVAKYFLLAAPKQKLVLMNFPQFWFFGHDIRLMLRGMCDDILGSYSGVLNTYLRSVLYGMDRNIALMMMEAILAEFPDAVVMSDRGPFSSCVTTGYIWANNLVTKDEVESEIVPQMFYKADKGMLEYFEHTSLVCKTEGGFQNSGIGSRKALDNYEQELPQIHAYKVYDMMNLPQILTKTKTGWRDSLEVVRETLSLSGYEQLSHKKIDEVKFKDDSILVDAQKSGQLILVGPETFLRHFGIWSKADARLRKMIDRWQQLSLLPFEGSSKDRKLILDDLETKIALSIKKLTKHIRFFSLRPSVHARKAIYQLLLEYPVILDLLERTSGQKMVNFLYGILEPEQLRLLL